MAHLPNPHDWCPTQGSFFHGPVPTDERREPDSERYHRCSVAVDRVLAKQLLPGPMPADDDRREAANNERCRRVLDDVLVAMVIRE